MLLSRVAISSMPGVSTLPAMTTMSAVRISPPVLSVAFTPAVIVLLRLRPESWLPRRRNIPLQIRLYLLHLQTERPLHLKNFAALVARNQRGSHAFFARASRTAHTMNKVLSNFRQIVVDDVHDVLHVNSARSHVRRHQNLITPLLESRQRGVALRLRAVAVNLRYRKSIVAQVRCDPLRAAFRAGKHQHAAGLFRQ